MSVGSIGRTEGAEREREPRRSFAPRGPGPTRPLGFAVLLAVSLLLVALILWPLWKPLLLAAVLAGSLARWHEGLAVRLGGRRGLSAALFTVALVLVILGPIAVLTTIAVQQAMQAVSFVREALRGGGVAVLIEALPARLEGLANRLLEVLPEGLASLTADAATGGRWAALTLSGLVSRASTFLFQLFMLVIAFFFLLTDGYRVVRWIESTAPLKSGQTTEILREFREISKSVIGTNVLTGAAQATVATAGYLIAGAPQPLFFGILTFFTSFIPSVGTAIVGLPLAALLIFLGRIWAGVFLAVYALAVVAMVDNFLRPYLMKGPMKLHGAVVFFALLGGIMLLGPMGLVVGPLAVTLFLTTVRLWQRDGGGGGRAAPSAS